jgi:hypothetical protein
MRRRRPSRPILWSWAAFAVLIVAGLIIGYTVSRAAGITLFVIGCAGYLAGGIAIFFVVPRRP